MVTILSESKFNCDQHIQGLFPALEKHEITLSHILLKICNSNKKRVKGLFTTWYPVRRTYISLVLKDGSVFEIDWDLSKNYYKQKPATKVKIYKVLN